MKQGLRMLIDNLDQVEMLYPEVTDTYVREEMSSVIYQSFILADLNYTLPERFGMFSSDGNQRVVMALAQFLHHPEVLAARTELSTPEQRMDAFEDPTIRSAMGETIAWFFGYWMR